MRTTNAKNWLGILFIVFGILWLTDNFNLFYFSFPIHNMFFSWNTFMIIMGAIIISKNNRTFFGYIILGFGIIGTIRHFPFFPFVHLLSFGNLWPIVIILAGVWIILNINGKRHNNQAGCFDQSEKYFTKGGPQNSEFWKESMKDKTNENFENRDSNNNFNFANNSKTYDADMIDEAAIFTSSKNMVTSQNFRGGKVSAAFGSVELNFTQAKLAPGEIILDVSAVFGSVEMRVPPEWKVVTNVSAAFGGFEDKRFMNPTFQPNPDSVLIVKGSVVFGGGQISY